MSSGDPKSGGLSVPTLIIASLSSLSAAIFIHKFWQGGAILGAAFTPIIVALVSETLRKPVEVVSTRATLPGRSARTREQPSVNPPPVVSDREDRFGIWEEQKRRPLRLKIVVATGLAAFVIAALFLTSAELMLGGASDTDRFRVLPGKQQRDRDRDEPPATTQPDQAEPAPGQDGETPPPGATTPPPAQTTPQTTPPEQPPPATSPPDPGTTTPVP